MEIELTQEEIQPFIEDAFQKVQKEVRLPGFRKGKVPRSLLEKQFGESIRHEAADAIISAFYAKAVASEGLDVAAPGKVEHIRFEEGSPFQFEAEVEVHPVVEVSSYTGIRTEKETQEVTDELVDETLNLLREQNAEISAIEGSAEKGDIIQGDVQEISAAGLPILGKKWEGWMVELGKAPLGDQLLDQLDGVTAGEERRFTVTSAMRSEEGREQNVQSHYSIKVNRVSEKKLPELDDAFAKRNAFESFDAMRQGVRRSIEARYESEAERQLRSRLIDEIIRRNEFEVPPSLVEKNLDSLWEEYLKNAREKVERNAFNEENRPAVLWNLKWNYIWRKIAELEKMQAGEEEVAREIDRMAQSSPNEEKKIRILFKDEGRQRRLQEHLLEEKVIAFLKENARIKETTVKPRGKRGRIFTR